MVSVILENFGKIIFYSYLFIYLVATFHDLKKLDWLIQFLNATAVFVISEIYLFIMYNNKKNENC
jgi:hypothetical protein